MAVWFQTQSMIRSFGSKSTEGFWRTGKTKGMPPADLRQVAMRKLQFLDQAVRLEELFSPPGNRLERLKGDRAGQHSIRINDQYRICFVWEKGDAYKVEIVDYH
jgi:toxin HigB-1